MKKIKSAAVWCEHTDEVKVDNELCKQGFPRMLPIRFKSLPPIIDETKDRNTIQ